MILLQQKNYMLGTDIFLTLCVDNDKYGNEIFDQLWSQISTFDQKFSRFIPGSELSLLNKNAGQKMQVSPEFMIFFNASLKMSSESDGLFNPLVLPSLQKAGYLGSWPKVEENIPGLNFSDRLNTDMDDIEFGKDWIKLPPKSALDSGGLGKGYLLDQLSNFLIKKNVNNYWLSLGGDIIATGNNIGKTGWEIGVELVNNENKNEEIIFTNGNTMAIATSGILKRSGVKYDVPWHHIIDPRTSLPAKTDILVATVTADSAALADIYAKSIIILGLEKAKSFIKQKEIPMAILQIKNQRSPLKIYGVSNDK